MSESTAKDRTASTVPVTANAGRVPYVGMVCAAALAGGFLYGFALAIPETKGKSLEEIQAIWSGGRNR